jgi:hypothetical protein
MENRSYFRKTANSWEKTQSELPPHLPLDKSPVDVHEQKGY